MAKLFQLLELVETMPIDQLISNIGGQLGLWAGISVITIYQAVFYLVCPKKMIRSKKIYKNSDNHKPPVT